MKLPIRIHFGTSPHNWHGRGNTTLTSTASVVKLDAAVHAWRFIVYGARGQWRHMDVFFPWWRRRDWGY